MVEPPMNHWAVGNGLIYGASFCTDLGRSDVFVLIKIIHVVYKGVDDRFHICCKKLVVIDLRANKKDNYFQQLNFSELHYTLEPIRLNVLFRFVIRQFINIYILG